MGENKMSSNEVTRTIWVVDPAVVVDVGAPVVERRVVDVDHETEDDGNIREFRTRKPAIKYALQFLKQEVLNEIDVSDNDIDDAENGLLDDEELPKKGIRKLFVVEDRISGQMPIIAEKTVEDRGEDMRAYRGLFNNLPKFRTKTDAIEYCLTDIRRNIRKERKALNEFIRRVA